MSPLPRRLALAIAFALLLPAPHALAQDAAPAATPTDVGRTYTPADFARFSPRSAYDMLRQVPGFVIRVEEEARGLGQATGNVLLNGQRLSAKSDDILTQLGRIPAANVVRIEIRDGATLDIPGLSGPVANVVAKAAGMRGQWKWEPDVRSRFTDPQLTRGEVSISGARGRLDYTLGFANGANHSGAGGGTVIYNADGSVRERREEVWTNEFDGPKLSAKLGYAGADGQVGNFNASVQRQVEHYVEDGTRTGRIGVADRDRAVRADFFETNHELGGDWSFGLGAGTLKLIGLARSEDESYDERVVVDFTDATPSAGDRFTIESLETERIARGEYRWKAGGDWQVSAEYAFNKLDSTSALYGLDAAGDFVPVAGFGGNAIVQEDRYEVMGSYGRALTDTLTLQLAAGGEYSVLEAQGQSRTFRRPKGQVSLAWKPTPQWNINAKLQRRVGQLEFEDFLASVDLNSGNANAGNPDLVPPQTTELELQASRDLGKYGTTSLRLYAQRIDDIVDTVPIGADGESIGNLEQATRHGFEWKATFNLDPYGWRGAKLDLRARHEVSRVTDPLTGEDRPISNNLKDLAVASLRHDVPDTNWAWGVETSYQFYSRNYRLTQVGRQWEGPIWGTIFVERKAWHGLTLRAEANNPFGARSFWNRTVYVDRRDGPVDFVEDRNRLIGPIFSFSVTGEF
jgi:outer membrane receptor for ferrienterochelin and colicins